MPREKVCDRLREYVSSIYKDIYRTYMDRKNIFDEIVLLSNMIHALPYIRLADMYYYIDGFRICYSMRYGSFYVYSVEEKYKNDPILYVTGFVDTGMKIINIINYLNKKYHRDKNIYADVVGIEFEPVHRRLSIRVKVSGWMDVFDVNIEYSDDMEIVAVTMYYHDVEHGHLKYLVENGEKIDVGGIMDFTEFDGDGSIITRISFDTLYLFIRDIISEELVEQYVEILLSIA